LGCRLRNGGVPDVADLAMLFVIGMGMPMAGRVRAQPKDGQDERDS
jgi:hypothetical protein